MAPDTASAFAARLETASMVFLAILLLWAPFPLGSAVTWGAPVMMMAVGLAWLPWALGAIIAPGTLGVDFRYVRWPLLIGTLVLAWCVVQIVPGTPWANPIWGATADLLHTAVPARITLNVWETETQILELVCYVAVAWLAFCVGRRSKRAQFLLRSISLITAAYTIYSIILRLLETSQAALIYRLPIPRGYISSPFMNHNGLATFCGLGAVASLMLFAEEGAAAIVSNRGFRRLLVTGIQFIFGNGALSLACFILNLGGVVASASRGGFIATFVGLSVTGVFLAIRTRFSRSALPVIAGSVLLVVPIIGLLVASGHGLSARLSQVLLSDTTLGARTILWDSALRIIQTFPWTGTGLGTFRDAYPMFASQVEPYVMDRVHCDYLELIAGIGWPAAIAWWAAMAWLIFLCVRGALIRRRKALFATAGVGASALVAVHSAVDFSLQLPAVALLYSVMLGIAVAQSRRTSDRHENAATAGRTG